MVPRFRHKVVEPALGLGNPCWVSDPEFDLSYHVRRIALPAGGTWALLLRTLEKLAMTSLDRGRSPWESTLIEGLPDGRAAHLLKMHHTATDGLGGVQLVGELHTRRRETTPDEPPPAAPPPQRTSRSGLLLQQLSRDVSALPSAARRVAESIVLKSYWVMVVLDQHTRRFVGFGIHRGPVDGPAVCRMFNAAIARATRRTKPARGDHPKAATMKAAEAPAAAKVRTWFHAVHGRL